MANQLNLQGLIDLFDRAARASGFMDFMPSPMIGHFVRQVLPSSISGDEIRLDPFYQWIRQEYSIPDHVFSRVFSRVEDDVKDAGYKLILPESFNPGVDEAIQDWLKTELKDVAYADLKDEMRKEVRNELLRELRPEVFRELREQYERESGVVPPARFEDDDIDPSLPHDGLGLEGIDELLTPMPTEEELREREEQRRRLAEQLRPEVERELREQLGPALCGEMSDDLKVQLRPAIEEQLRQDLREAVEAELRDSIEAKLRRELQPVLHETVSSELRAVGHEQLTESLRAELEAKVKDELRKQLWSEVRDEVKEDLRSVLKPVLEAELRSEVRKDAPPRTRDIEFLDHDEAGPEECEGFVRTGETADIWAEPPPKPKASRGLGLKAPRGLGLKAEDQLDIIKKIRAELTPSIREQIIADLHAVVRAQAEQAERQRRLEQLTDPDYCLEKIRSFLFPEQPNLWAKVKSVIQPEQWRVIVLAVEQEQNLDDERLNRSRQVIRDALQIKAEIEEERTVPDRLRDARGGKARLQSVNAMLKHADDLLDFALTNIQGLLAEAFPDEQLDLTA